MITKWSKLGKTAKLEIYFTVYVKECEVQNKIVKINFCEISVTLES